MDTIRERAYQIYEDRIANGISGTSEDDWNKAEEELRFTSGTTQRTDEETEQGRATHTAAA